MLSVTEEDLCLYCRIDTEEQKALAIQLADACEDTLLAKGILYSERTALRFALLVKAMTLHEMDHPGAELPRGIREKINDLKFNR